MAYDRGRFELFVLLSLSLPDDLCLRFLPLKGLVLGADFSTGGVEEALRDDAEEKSEWESDSDESEDSKVIGWLWAIMITVAEGCI